MYDDGYESWSPAEAFESGYVAVGAGLNVKQMQDILHKILGTDEPLFIIRGKDKLSAQIVSSYMEFAGHMGCLDDFVNKVASEAELFSQWQAANPHKVRMPD